MAAPDSPPDGLADRSASARPSGQSYSFRPSRRGFSRIRNQDPDRSFPVLPANRLQPGSADRSNARIGRAVAAYRVPDRPTETAPTAARRAVRGGFPAL